MSWSLAVGIGWRRIKWYRRSDCEIDRPLVLVKSGEESEKFAQLQQVPEKMKDCNGGLEWRRREESKDGCGWRMMEV